jgi:hypothetical protein
MADEVADGFEAPPAEAKLDPVPAGAALVCPDCGAEFDKKLNLGRHRWQIHGVRGITHGTKKKSTTKKSTASASAGANTGGSREPTQAALLKRARASLIDAMETGGGFLVFAMPVTGTYCVNTADTFADSMIRVAGKNPKVLAWLVKSGGYMDYAALGSWVFGLGIAVAVETRRMHPDAPIAAKRGISDLFHEFYVVDGTPAYDAREGVNDDESSRDGGLGPAGQPGRIAVPDLLASGVGTPSA